MHRRSVSFLLIITLFAPTFFGYAQTTPTLNSLVVKVLQEQSVSSIQQLNCSAISQSEFAQIGDAWMDLRHPNEQEHAFMDNMMGGEGSASLQSAYTAMGERYLGCLSAQAGYAGYGSMMGGYWAASSTTAPQQQWGYGMGMMRGYYRPYSGWSNMMGWGGPGYFSFGGTLGMILMTLIPLLILVLLILAIVYLGKRIRNLK